MDDISSLTTQFKQAYEKGDFIKAAELGALLDEAYQSCDNALMAAEARNNRSVALLKAGLPQAALEAAGGTDEIFAADDDPRRQAMALGNQAAALDALGKLKQAEALYRQSADLLQKIGERELYAIVMKSLSTIYMRQGKQLDTVAALQASLEDGRQLSGKERIIKKLLKGLLSLRP